LEDIEEMNAFIVGQQRTGSTLLYEFLDSHPGIFCADELFIMRGVIDYRFRMIKVYNWYKNNKGWSIDQYLKWLFGFAQHSCVKILYHQINHFNMEQIVLNTPVIQIVRKNYFKRVVSQYHTTARIGTRTPNEYINDIRAAIGRDEVWAKALKPKCPKYMKLHFENLVGRHEVVRNTKYTFCNKNIGEKLCKFFGVPYFEMFTATQKALNKKDYWEYIPEKFRDELRKRLSVFPDEVWK